MNWKGDSSCNQGVFEGVGLADELNAEASCFVLISSWMANISHSELSFDVDGFSCSRFQPGANTRIDGLILGHFSHKRFAAVRIEVDFY